MRNLFSAGLMILCGLAAVSIASAENLVLNGGFETGDFSDWTQGGNIDGFSAVTAAFPHSGTYAADLGALETDFTLDQTLTVDPSTQYDITFYLSQRFPPDPANGVTNAFSASFDGHLLLNEINAPFSGYQQFSYTITTGASDTSAVLDFEAFNDADFFHLDDVSVSEDAASATPEPASVFLAAAGLLTCLVSARRRRPRA